MITFAVISKVLVSKTSIDKYVLHANLHCCFLHLIMLNIMSALLFGQKNEKMGNGKNKMNCFFSTVPASKRKECVRLCCYASLLHNITITNKTAEFLERKQQ